MFAESVGSEPAVFLRVTQSGWSIGMCGGGREKKDTPQVIPDCVVPLRGALSVKRSLMLC